MVSTHGRKLIRLRLIRLAWFAGILALVLLLAFGIRFLLDLWTEEIVASNTSMTREAVHAIAEASTGVLDSIYASRSLRAPPLCRAEFKMLDRKLSELVTPQLRGIIGMEGGFYLADFDELLGYSWPSSPPPPPAYGPAPRSYQIILDQLRTTVRLGQPQVEFHRFDFATFPLATEPVRVRGVIVGAVWARIHVEKELPSSRIGRWLSTAVGIALLALLIVFIMTVRLRVNVAHLRRGLDQLRADPKYRLPDNPGVFGAIGAAINTLVDSQQREQEKREELERELHQQDKMATLGRLVAGVAHEVKTPLANIKTRVQMWQRRMKRNGGTHAETGGISDESMNLVVGEIDRLSDLVKRLLVFSKPVSNKKQEIPLNDVLRQVAARLETEAEVHGISLRLELDPLLPAAAIDAQAMEHVFLNIITNALEAVQSGGTVTIRTRTAPAGGAIEAEISDTGPGIPDDIRNKVFDPFFTTKEQGAGLGLSISYEIVHAHGGTIEFRPSPAGACCVTTLPVPQKRKARP